MVPASWANSFHGFKHSVTGIFFSLRCGTGSGGFSVLDSEGHFSTVKYLLFFFAFCVSVFGRTLTITNQNGGLGVRVKYTIASVATDWVSVPPYTTAKFTMPLGVDGVDCYAIDSSNSSTATSFGSFTGEDDQTVLHSPLSTMAVPSFFRFETVNPEQVDLQTMMDLFVAGFGMMVVPLTFVVCLRLVRRGIYVGGRGLL